MNTEAEATSGADGGAVSKGAGSGSGAVLLNQPIVIDTGTGSVKAGFAGGSKPKVSWGLSLLFVMSFAWRT